MRFDPPLQAGRLRQRYKRFLADIETDTGEALTIHCPNTGAMLGCDAPGSRVWYSDSGNPKRKYRHTLEAVETAYGMAGIHSARANALIGDALSEQALEPFAGYAELRRETPIPELAEEAGRFDFTLSGGTAADCVVEVKSVTYARAGGFGCFPDAVSTRGLKHLRGLVACAQAGYRAALVYCVQHHGIQRVTPAADIDPDYARQCALARDAGVEFFAFAVAMTRAEFRITKQLPVEIAEAPPAER